MKAPREDEAGYYHCVSRVVDRRRVFREVEKERFVSLLRECEAFCEVRVLTYCLMANHFHILAEVPRRPKVLPTAEEVLAKVRRPTGYSSAGLVEQQIRMYQQAKDVEGLRRYLETFYVRMWDVSGFMKMLKQRFTQWYNGCRNRKGKLWDDRFKSVLVEGAGQALSAMAAYIDLSPVRARIVKDPKEYRWCGYAEAVAGKGRALEGLGVIARALLQGKEATLREGLNAYRLHMFNEGTEERESLNTEGKWVPGALSRDAVLGVFG